MFTLITGYLGLAILNTYIVTLDQCLFHLFITRLTNEPPIRENYSQLQGRRIQFYPKNITPTDLKQNLSKVHVPVIVIKYSDDSLDSPHTDYSVFVNPNVS